MKFLDTVFAKVHHYPYEYGQSEKRFHKESNDCWCMPYREILKCDGKWCVCYIHNHVLCERTDTLPSGVALKDAPEKENTRGWLYDEYGENRIAIQDARARMNNGMIGSRLISGFRIMAMGGDGNNERE